MGMTEDFLRHAVGAAEVAAVGDGQSQVMHLSAQLVWRGGSYHW
jgi:hypothetical protein